MRKKVFYNFRKIKFAQKKKNPFGHRNNTNSQKKKKNKSIAHTKNSVG